MVNAYLVFLVILALERMVELLLSRKNAAWALERGGIERGQQHFRFMQVLHAGLFAACVTEVVLLERPFIAALGWPMLGVVLAAQGLRYWAIKTLGPYWNVRVIVVPGAAAINAGPYRFLRHPNYLAVILEGIAVPLIHSAYLSAIAFTVLNAVLLIVRIRCEESALRQHCQYEKRLGGRPRLLPGPVGVAT